MYIIVYEKDNLFNLVKQQTVYLSDVVGTKKTNADTRVPDVIPLTDNDRDFFDVALPKAGDKVFREVANLSNCVTFPYYITDDTNTEYPNSVVYRFEMSVTTAPYINVPMMQQAMSESLIYSIITDWLQTKGWLQQAQIYAQKTEDSLLKIKTAANYGIKAKVTYRTL